MDLEVDEGCVVVVLERKPSSDLRSTSGHLFCNNNFKLVIRLFILKVDECE